MECNDNLLALKILKDVTKLLNAIENSNSQKIVSNLKDIKIHIAKFEEVFYEYKSDGIYK